MRAGGVVVVKGARALGAHEGIAGDAGARGLRDQERRLVAVVGAEIALLAAGAPAIPAARRDAGVAAVVVVDLVAVVARLDPPPQPAVAAAGDATPRDAAVAVVLVAVVARLDAAPDERVAARGARTRRQAGVAVILVAVVAQLTGIDDAVPAGIGAAARAAAVVTGPVAVVAKRHRLPSPQRAGAQALVHASPSS